MNCNEQSPKATGAKSGLLATISDLLSATGIKARALANLAALLACAASFFAFFAFFASSALAGTPNFCPSGSSAGHCDSPIAVAVDQSTGTVYVGEGNNARISAFDSSGDFLRAFGFGVLNGANELQTCEAACIGGLFSGLRPGALAVDNSGGPSAHDVYASNNARVEKYTLNPLSNKYELLFSFGPAGTGPGQFSGGASPITVDSSGRVWVGDKNRLEQFGENGEFLSEVALPGAGEVRALALDTDSSSPSFGNFYTLAPRGDEQQLLHLPASGNYTLTFEGQTTGELAFDTPPSGGQGPTASVQNALEALPTIGQGNMESFDALSGKFAVIFRGALGNTNVPQISISAGSVETVVDGADGLLSKRKPNGELIETIDASGHPNALGLDPATGNLFVGDCPSGVSDGQLCPGYTLLEFDHSGAQTEAFGSGEVIGNPSGNALAFGDTAQRLYVVSSSSEKNNAAQAFALPEPGPLPGAGTSKASEVKKLSAALGAEVSPEGKATTCHFQYITEAQFKADGNSFGAGTIDTTESASIGEDFQPHPASRAISSLTPATVYRFRVICHNENGTVDGETASFETLPPAAIDSTSASEVTASSATLEAEINPLGDATSYRFQYLTAAEYEENLKESPDGFSGAHLPTAVPVAGGPLGSGSADVSVSQHIQGLDPHAVYRYRAVVSNAVSEANGGPFAGPTQAFTTQAFASLGLPDNRAWEQVSPPEKHGGNLGGTGGEKALIQASAAGNAIAYGATAPTELAPRGNANETKVLSVRSQAGWSSLDLSPPHGTPSTATEEPEYQFFSADLSLGLFQLEGSFPPLSPAASEETPYLRNNLTPANSSTFCTASCDRPLITGCPKEGQPCSPAVEEAADVPPGTEFGNSGGTTISFLGATPDLAHVVLTTEIALTSTPLSANRSGLYEWTSANPPSEQLQLLSLLPGGEPITTGSRPGLGTASTVARNAISVDGTRVIFSQEGGHLYLRENATAPQSQIAAGQCTEPTNACTVQIDVLQGGPGGSQTPAPQFQTASADDSRLFFTDPQQLTPDSGAGNDLYEYDLEAPAGERLTDLTPSSAGESAAVQGLIAGASDDGSQLYFVANGVLTGEQENEQGEKAQPGTCHGQFPPPGATCNLYRYDTENRSTRLIAVLSGQDFPDWAGADLALKGLTSRVSPDGRRLAFMSQRSLTGYDNHDAVSGQPDEEVYLYDADATGGDSKLVCASCDPTGSRPHGVKYGGTVGNGNPSLPLAGGDRVWPGTTWLAANIPGWTSYTLGRVRYQSRYLSNSGRLFFNSSDALVPADTNGAEDVYQFEPPESAEGAPEGDTCTTTAPTYSPTSEGCADLISSGTSAKESAFLDASESGDDVFFITSAQLTKTDIDTSPDYYDARIGGGFPEPAKPIECSGDACQPPAVPPNHPTPGTALLNGPGNVFECPKDKVKKAGKCVAKHHKKKHPKKNKKKAHKRANTNRGAGK